MCTGFNHLQVVLICAAVINAYGAESNNAEAKGRGRRGPASEFTTHRIVTPSLSHLRTRRHITTTREQGGQHAHDITLGLTLGEEDILVDLQLNRNLLPRDYFEKYYHNGSQYVQRPVGQAAGLCHYQGVIRGRPGSWAALSTCNGVSGVVFDGEELHYVERIPETPPAVDSPHYHFKHSDIVPQNFSCGYSGKPHPVRDLFHDETFSRLLRYKRSSDDSKTNNIRGPYNANALSRYVELVLVADKTVFEKHGHDVTKIYNRCKDIANIVNALYQPLNIFIALVGVEVWQDEDQVEISTNGDKTLTNFLNYRKVRLIRDHPNDNAQLLTGKQFDAGVVGKALKGPICTYQYSGGVNMDHSDTVGLVATTVAHEMGHNFGMEHDTEEECECPDKRCIMAPSSGSKSPTHWSSCSYEYLALSFERSMDYCLRNKPTSLFDSPVCGNGYVEPGEQCDCGLAEYCNNPCCNATTCMLYLNATCATGHCCDLQTCRPKLAGVECRSSAHECDLPEFCTGDSEYCPDDVFKLDGHDCMGGQAFCHSGMCRTHEEQCKLLWGPTGQSSDDRCYMMNTQGTHNGNCGYNWVNDTYYKCTHGDIKCGMLHCMHLNERLEFGMESVSKVSHSFLRSNEGVIPCRVALVDMGLDMVDPGLAPDGAKCGRGKMCVNQRCMPVSNLKFAACDCHGHGVCNNNGHCHCDVGFAPPDCLYPGLGGSEDSGPASNPHATNNFVIGMFVFFLGIVPGVLVVLCLVYYTRGNLKLWWETKGRPATSKLPHVDPNRRTSRPPGTLEVESGMRPEIGPPVATVSPRSPTPPSSQGSKSNSPLLNGHATHNFNGGEGGNKSNYFTRSLFGRHEGFTLSPLKEAKSPPETKSGTTLPEPKSGANPPGVKAGANPPGVKSSANPPPIPPLPVVAVMSTNVPSTKDTTPASNGVAKTVGWQPKGGGLFQTNNNSASSGPKSKMLISGPSLQGSTNPAIASVLPSRTAPPPPPPSAPIYGNIPLAPESQGSNEPIAVFSPTQPPPSLPTRTQPPLNLPTRLQPPPSFPTRPLSVPDAATLVAQANKQELEQSDGKQLDGDKPSKVARIASFLSKKDKQGGEDSQQDVEAGSSNTLPRKAAKIKRESLMQLEISAPMQLHATELPANLVPVRSAPDPPMPGNLKPSQVKTNQEEAGKANKVSWAPSVPEDKGNPSNTADTRSNLTVTWKPSEKEGSEKETDLFRIGSMRETPVTIRPSIPKFGSMRAPRPKSLPPTRPSEPPPRPPLPMIPGTPESEYFYDDCLNVQEGPAPIANMDEDSTPEGIYATIDEKTPDSPLQEVTYTPQDSSEGKKEKKSIFSFLYNKPKKKSAKEKDSPEEIESPAEPIYCNIIEPLEAEPKTNNEGDKKEEEGKRESSLTPPSPSLLDSKRTSCGSSEDGGLLSEIVTELSTRDEDFVSSLAKNKNKKSKEVSKPSADSISSADTGKKDISIGKFNRTSSAEDNKIIRGNKNLPSASSGGNTKYPWRSNKETVVAKKLPTLGTTPSLSTTTTTETLPTFSKPTPSGATTSGPTPRGVFSYMNAAKKDNENHAGKNLPTSSTANTKSNSGSFTDKKPQSSEERVGPAVNKGTTSATASAPVPSKSLAASLAAVRAAGAAAGEAAAAAAVGEANNKPTSTSSNTSKPSGGASVTRPTRPLFPPDKVLFPPDKAVSSSTGKVVKAEPTKAGAAKAQVVSPTSKATTPTSKVGKVLSPTRGTTPTRNTPGTSSGRGDKSRSTTPQPVAKKTISSASAKTEQKPTTKPTEKAPSKTFDKATTKASTKPGEKPSDGQGPKKTIQKGVQGAGKGPVGGTTKASTTGVSSGLNKVGRVSNVASLQKKFEKKESESQDSKPLTKAPSRKSQEVKPVLAPKPK